jgi:hypothetical protein
VTFQYNGTAPFSFANNKVAGRINFKSDNDAVMSTMLMLYGLGELNKLKIINAPPNLRVEPMPRIHGEPAP